nr:immunoglobulin heavy chain junction region [Macaca mulatta]MOV39498.1 immunoglobulin heavy chain junction region [Macaca mulatta]MOV40030.1 immunoglobulin heavy chain junction region [Macaca mulatta]MOV40074.1 immunoglobulin heavy chain junction region [Macaca mulatta]MOV40697.1 immunoglobulin heavy chain junction region [Macaca mulatta]
CARGIGGVYGNFLGFDFW